jgi:uncharacterized phage protein gp47/JayE
MPWSTPTLAEVRGLVRDSIRAKMPGADALIPNSVLRVMSDSQGALCHATLQYIDWLALQLLPDTSETEWLDRHGDIWLVNSDGTTGRKLPTLAEGSASFQGTVDGSVIPLGTQLISNVQLPAGSASANATITFETLDDITTYIAAPSTGSIRAVDAGSIGNLDTGTTLMLSPAVVGVSPAATVVALSGGTDSETDDELRTRILRRIRQPPMGGAAYDYEAWALAVPGVTRAWCAPLEMGIGTVTIRFMMDDLRASNGGFPLPEDIDTVKAYIDTVRPVAVKDYFVEAPIPYPVNLRISFLDYDDGSTRAAIEQSLLNEFFLRATPGQYWYRAWSDEGIANAFGVNAYDLVASDVPMPSSGYMAVLGDLTYG